MPLRSGLAVWCYSLGTGGASAVAVEYGNLIESLSFTQLAPGGCGSLDAKIRLSDARLPRPELAMFSRVAIMDPSLIGTSACVWNGEISDPEYTFTESEGEYVRLVALGLGSTLRDDPGTFSYNNQTPLQIVQNQMTTGNRPNYLVIDSDQTGVFPDNPNLSLSPAYPGRTMEEIIQDVCSLAGDYTYGVWPHPRNKDAAGFPTGQLLVHKRDPNTVSYTASIAAGDLVGYRVTPSGERAYNVIQIAYFDQTQSPPSGTVSFTDSRLAGNGSQGSAPFRRRLYYRDLTGTNTATKAQCQSIANTYGGLYSNVTNKVELTLRAVRDANGNPIPLWQIQADTNIYVPEMAVRGTQLVTAPTQGTNVFYIKEVRYAEDASGNSEREFWIREASW